MLTPDEILELAKSKAVDFRKWENESKSGRKSEYPDYTPVYAETVKMAEHIAIHAENETFPKSLFKKKRPNESDEQFEYIEMNFKPVTKPYWNRACSIFNRVWNTQNFHINWQTEKEADIYKEDTAYTYFTQNYPIYKSIQAFFQSIVSNHKTNDPNAVRAIKPYYIPTKKNDAGEPVLDDTKLIEPFSVIYGAEQILDFKENSHCLILLHERSELKTGNNSYEKVGLIFEYYDLNTIWRITQIGKKSEEAFEAVPYYQHNLNKLPCKKLQGIPIQKGEDVYYKSILADAVPNLDIALVHHQTLEASVIANAFPQYWEYVDKCEGTLEEPCQNGQVGFGEDQHKCGVCNGTGKTNKRSVLGAIQLITPQRFDDGDTQLPNPPAGYIEQNTAILDFLEKYVERNAVQAFAMLNIDVSNSDVKGSDVALSKKIDREELFATILNFSDEIFALYKDTIEISGLMRYGDKFNMPEIQPPVDFAIRSEQDLTEELAKAKESGVPVAAFRYIAQQYLRVRCNSEILLKREELRFSVDSLVTEDAVTIMAMVGGGIVPKWKAVLHNEFDIYLDSLLAEDKEFLNKPLAEQSKTLIEKAKAEVNGMQMQGFNAEGIIAGMAGENTPVDVEAEAKARLKGTVGGVQGVLEIQKSVAEGLTDRDAAIALMVEIYGFSEELSGKMLGSPIKLTPTSAPKVEA